MRRFNTCGLAVVLVTSFVPAWHVCLADEAVRHADPAIERALRIVGHPLGPVNIVSLQEIREIYRHLGAGAPPAGLNAFRLRAGGAEARIYVNRDSRLYRRAARHPSPLDLLRLAATLVHEQVHDTDGEHAAYTIQADFVRCRLAGLPRKYRQDARLYLQQLDARADARGQAERRLRERRTVDRGASGR
jgi:hypothetical protein